MEEAGVGTGSLGLVNREELLAQGLEEEDHSGGEDGDERFEYYDSESGSGDEGTGEGEEGEVEGEREGEKGGRLYHRHDQKIFRKVKKSASNNKLVTKDLEQYVGISPGDFIYRYYPRPPRSDDDNDEGDSSDEDSQEEEIDMEVDAALESLGLDGLDDDDDDTAEGYYRQEMDEEDESMGTGSGDGDDDAGSGSGSGRESLDRANSYEDIDDDPDYGYEISEGMEGSDRDEEGEEIFQGLVVPGLVSSPLLEYEGANRVLALPGVDLSESLKLKPLAGSAIS
jgi:hypothetical protein